MQSDKKLLYIVNPVSGKGKAAEVMPGVCEIFDNAGWNVTVHKTGCAGDAERIARECASQYELVVCSGGDGTYHETLNGILSLDKKPLLGYIPAGTTNDFAYSIGLPKDPLQCARIIMDGEPFACDVGSFNGKIFSYTAAFGIFTNVTYETPQELKNTFGKMAYVMEAVKQLQKIPYHRLNIRSGEWVFEGEFLIGMISNSLSVAGMRGIAGKKVYMDDGLLEVLLVKRPPNPVVLGDILFCILSGKPYHEYIVSFKTAELSIAGSYMSWTLDGEYGGTHEEVLIKDIPRAVNIIRPKQKQ